MVSQDKLIKKGIYLTDNVFDEILKRLSRGIRASDTLEAFITRTKEYTMNNPLVVNGFKDDMLDIILRETNNHKFGRPAQKELVRLTIENRVGDLIVDVGDDIRSSVRDIVKHGYNNNLSQDEIAKEITKKVTTIKNTRAALIARTEIARTATASDYVINKERGATHFVVDCRNTCCDVCRKDYKFGVVEYNIDQVEMLPPRHPRCRCYARFFKKDGAVNITSKKPVSTTQTTTTTTIPTEAQLKANLTKEELEKVEWAKSVQTSDFISEKGKAIARQTLEDLYKKALGESDKTTFTPEPKTTTTKKQPTKPTETTKTSSVESMSSQELYDSMTKADKNKYDKAKQKLATVEKNLKTIGENDLLLGMKKDRLLEIRQLEQKQRDKLANKGKRKPKQKPVRTNERTVENIHNEVDLPLKKLIPTLEKWIDKRCKNTSEFGYHFDISTGEIIGGLKDGEIRGVKGRIAMADLGSETGSIHSHPRNGMSAPSIEDLETFRCKKQNHHFMVSEHEIWYVEATDSFGIGAMGQQLDLQKAHKDCRNRAFKQVENEIKNGKLEATEEVIAKKLDEYTGNEILKTFNSPPWDKTMTVKRYYR